MPVDASARIRNLLAAQPVVDGHNDLAWEARERVAYDWSRLDVSRRGCPTHTDLPPLRDGGVGAQSWCESSAVWLRSLARSLKRWSAPY